MNTDIQIFENPEFGQIRTMADENGEPWFVGRDVAEMLGYNQADKAINRHVDEDDRMKRTVIDPLDRNQMTYIINESGLYTENNQKIGLKINSFECFMNKKCQYFLFIDSIF